MLKIKKSHRNKDEWIVYNPDNFQLHTHCRSMRVAVVIRDNVARHRLPKSTDIRLLTSHIRVTRNKQYIRLLEERINEIMGRKNELLSAWIFLHTKKQGFILAFYLFLRYIFY